MTKRIKYLNTRKNRRLRHNNYSFFIRLYAFWHTTLEQIKCDADNYF